MRDVEAAAEAPPYLRVDLQPLLVESERTALYSIAAQVRVSPNPNPIPIPNPSPLSLPLP